MQTNPKVIIAWASAASAVFSIFSLWRCNNLLDGYIDEALNLRHANAELRLQLLQADERRHTSTQDSAQP